MDESVGWRVRSEQTPFGNGRIGELQCVGPTWQLEVQPEELGRLMRHVFSQPQKAKEKGAAACRRVQEGWTWEHTGRKMIERLEEIRRKGLEEGRTGGLEEGRKVGQEEGRTVE